jgi:cation diffusion facilitator family transporter
LTRQIGSGILRDVTQAANRDELRALRLSLAVTILFTVGALAIALVSDSETMTLEAMAGLVDVVVSLLALFVARKIHEPANERYHFGYAKYEPLMIGLEGALIATICLTAIAYAVKDLVHPDPIDAPLLVIGYSMAGFLLSVSFGACMKHLGRRAGSPLVLAEAQLWIIDGWLSLGVCIAFFLALVLSGTLSDAYSAYVDPVVCIVLSLIFLRKPAELLRESFADLVDANPCSETLNTVEQSARECVERYHLRDLEWVRLRKAGRRLFVLVSFFEPPQQSLEAMERARTGVINDMVRLNPDVDVSVLFRSV